MNSILLFALTNAIIATALFAVILALKPILRNPTVLHWLWLLVLVKLITPPLWTPRWELLPAAFSSDSQSVALQLENSSLSPLDSPSPSPPELTAAAEIQASPVLKEAGEKIEVNPIQAPASQGEVTPAKVLTLVTPQSIAITIWATGALLLWALSIWRIHRFQSGLRFAEPAPLTVHRTAQSLAKQLGLNNSPRILLAPGRVSPMLWAFLGPAKIIVPRELYEGLNDSGRETLLLHELAHYCRGDHWVRRLELFVVTLYWWFPLAWLLRREIRKAEELACDAVVVSQRPEDRRTYAKMLVNTVAFLSGAGVPSLATGASASLQIEARVQRIMKSTIETHVSRNLKLLVCSIAVLVLPLAPLLARARRMESGPSEISAVTQDAKTASNSKDEAKELTGTVVDEAGKPVSGIAVAPFLHGHRVDQAPGAAGLVTDALGQFRVPADWIGGVDGDSDVFFVVRKEDTHIGWFDLLYLKLKRDRNQVEGDARNQFKIVLLPMTTTIRGTLVDNAGKPLSGIQVGAESLSQPTNQSFNRYGMANEELFSTITDREGNFAIKIPTGAQGALVPLHPEWQRSQIRFSPNSTELGPVSLEPAGRIEGRVIEKSTGKPLAGQRVVCQIIDTNRNLKDQVTYGAATTGPDGKYVIGGLSPGRFNVLFGGSSKVTGSPSLTAIAVEGVDVVVGRSSTADFTAITGRKLSGIVVDGASGKPLANISVGYYGTARPTSGAGCIMVRTNPEGKFEFQVPPGVSKVYVAEGDRGRHEDASRTIELPEDRDFTDLLLKAGPKETLGSHTTEIQVPVREKQKPKGAISSIEMEPYHLKVALNPPEGKKANKATARVVFVGSQYSHSWTLLTATGNEITFNEDSDQATAFLLIEAEGFAPLRSAEFVVSKRMPELKVELKPEVRVPIRGQVIDAKGVAVEGARIRLARHIHAFEEEFPWGLEYATGKGGQFEIKHVRQGDRIQLRIDKPGISGADTEWIKIGAEENIVLPDLIIGTPNRSIGGRVEDIDSLPVAGAKVIYAGEPRQETTTDEQGKFRLSGLPTGNITLSIEPKDLPKITPTIRTGKLDHYFVIGKRSPQDVADYQVDVTLRPRDGKEIAEVASFFAAEDGKLLYSQSERHGASHHFAFADYVRRNEGKNFAIIVAAKGYALSKPVIVPNKRGPHAIEIELEPAEPITLRGRVIDEAGSPIPGATVGLSTNLTDTAKHHAWSPINSKAKPPTTDNDGKFEIKDIQPNSRIAIYANKEGRAGAWSEKVLVEGKSDLVLPDLRVPQATAEIAGIVVDSDGKPVANAAVWIVDLAAKATTTSDAQGRFSLKKVPGHNLLLRASSETSLWSQYVTPDGKEIEVKLAPIPTGG